LLIRYLGAISKQSLPILLDLGLSSSSSVFSTLGGIYFCVEVYHPNTTDTTTLMQKRGNMFIEGGHFEHHYNMSKSTTTTTDDDSNIVAFGIRFRIDIIASMIMKVVDNNFRKKKGRSKETELYLGNFLFHCNISIVSIIIIRSYIFSSKRVSSVKCISRRTTFG
jgi:hypothetical protein